MHTTSLLSRLYRWSLVALAFTCVPLASAAQYRLVTGAAKSVLVEPASSPRILRQRAVTLDLPAAAKAAGDARASLQVAFFEDAVFNVFLKRQEATHSGGTAYSGEVAGIAQSLVILVDNDGTVTLRVSMPGKRFSIRGSAERGYVAREHVDADRPDHGPHHKGTPMTIEDVPAPRAKDGPGEVPPPGTARDDGTNIDVLVVYTQAARAAAGGSAQMNTDVDAEITQTNTIYANSNVVQRLRLVYKGEIAYTEVDMDTDLPRLRSGTDGHMDAAPILRDLYMADFVALLGVYNDYCGLGFLMATETASFAANAFSITAQDCIGPGNYTFAHELGHNMGLRHDNFQDTTALTRVTPEAGGGLTDIFYAHGYIDLVNRFRTVMAYNDQCAAQASPFGCFRAPNFSNPAVNFNNNAFYGPAVSAPTGNAGNAHERQVLNDTRDSTSNFRQPQLAVFTGPGVLTFLPTSGSVAEGGGNMVLTVGRHIGSTGAVSVSYTTTAGTAAAGSDYTTTNGTLNWAAGDETDKTITVPILQDTTLEGHETFTVTLSAPTNGATIAVGGGAATGRINDDEPDTYPAGGVLPAGYTTPDNPNANTPNSQWTVDATQGRLSTASLQSAQALSPSGGFTIDGTSDLEYTANFSAGQVSFYYKLSSYHAGLGGFEFQVDGVAVFSNNAGGEVDWTLVTHNLPAGQHTLRWRFKNKLPFPCANANPAPPGGGNCADRAWIDSVALPPDPASLFTLTVARTGSGVGSVAGTGIACPADCQEAVAAGTPVVLTAAPNAGSVFAAWTNCDTPVGNQCTVTVSADRTVTATFQALTTFNVVLEGFQESPYVITAGSGTVTATFNPVNSQLTLDLAYSGLSSAETMAHIHGLAARGANAGVLHDLFPPTTSPRIKVVTLTAPQVTQLLAGQLYVNVHTANFGSGEIRGQIDNLGAVVPRVLTVVKAGAGTGSIGGTTEAGTVIACPGDCSETVPHGKVVALTATPAGGATFAGWTGACTGTGACNVTMDAAKTVTATFNSAVSSVTLTVTKAGTGTGTVASSPAGTIACGATCSASVVSGTVVQLVATASAGSNFAGWSNACTGSGACSVTVDAAKTVTATFNLDAPPNPPRLGNISTRMQVLTGNDVMIGGFVIGGSGNKTVVVRARGPSLIPFGITNALANPQLQLVRSSDQATIATNDDFGSAANLVALNASGFAPSNALESAILANLAPGAYTAIVSGVANGTGVGIVEVFEVDGALIPLANISTRGQVLTGNDVMIGGFVIQGSGSQTVVVRARGPSLIPFGIANALANPQLSLVRASDQVTVATNDDWQSATNAAAITASGFAPSNGLEAAILVTLPPGAYTAVVTGVGGGTGVAIVEVFAQ